MPSKFLSLTRKSYGFRLVVWFFAIFVAGFLSVSIISYAFLSSSLRDNRKAIQTKLEELISLGEKSGVGAGISMALKLAGMRRCCYCSL